MKHRLFIIFSIGFLVLAPVVQQGINAQVSAKISVKEAAIANLEGLARRYGWAPQKDISVKFNEDTGELSLSGTMMNAPTPAQLTDDTMATLRQRGVRRITNTINYQAR